MGPISIYHIPFLRLFVSVCSRGRSVVYQFPPLFRRVREPPAQRGDHLVKPVGASSYIHIPTEQRDAPEPVKTLQNGVAQAVHRNVNRWHLMAHLRECMHELI